MKSSKRSDLRAPSEGSREKCIMNGDKKKCQKTKVEFWHKRLVLEFSGGLPSEERLILLDSEISVSGLCRGAEV